MTTVTVTDERLNALLCDLEARVRRPGQVPYQAMQELGQFMEEVHTALGLCLGFDQNEIKISAWHKQIEKHGYNCHAAKYGALDAIYGYRNIASHPNEEKHSITRAETERRLADVKELLLDLCQRLTDHPLIDRLYEVQACSRDQLRARTLCSAIEATGDVKDYIERVLTYGLPFIPERSRGFLKAPRDKQLPKLLSLLGRLCSTSDSDVLKGLAAHVMEGPADALNFDPVRRWLAQYGTPTVLGSAPYRLPVIRLTLDRDPRQEGAILVRHVSIVEPIIAGLADYLPEFPLTVPDLNQLYVEIVKLLNGIRPAFSRISSDGTRTGEVQHWREFVLDVETPPDLAAMDFESACGGRPGRDFTSLFRCVTIRPLADDALRPLGGLDRPVVHPRHDKNGVAVWATGDARLLYRAAQGRDCLFTGPAGWNSGGSIPPVVEAFEGFPGAIVCPADNDADGLKPLFEDTDERVWSDLLDRVNGLRLGGAWVKVLWNDPAYDLMLAESL